MYGTPSSGDPLAWEAVEGPLAEAGLYWVDIGGGDAPHPRAVWGIWHHSVLHLTIGSPTLRRLAVPGAPVAVHLESGLDVVIVNGQIGAPGTGPDLLEAYDRKYDWVYDIEQYGPMTSVIPSTIIAWRAAGPAGREGFTHTGSWTFDRAD